MRPNATCAIFCAFALSVVIACLQSFRACILALGLGAFFIVLARPNFNFAFKRLRAANAFILFTWLVVPFTTPGREIYSFGPLSISERGVELCALVTFKANAIVCVFLALVTPYSIIKICSALKALGLPEKLIWLFLLMEANIRVFANRFKALSEGARLRAFTPRFNSRTYKTTSALIAILLINARDRAETMNEALLLRGYAGKLPNLPTPTFGLMDWTLFLCVLAAGSLLILSEIGII